VSYSVAVVGAGWYGCHIASSLQALGFRATVFESHARPLHEASGNNQFRLHLGFHYPRHHQTRLQSRDGFMRFIERYPSLSEPIAENIYAVPKQESLIDFATYKLIMTSSGIEFTEPSEASIDLQNIQGMLFVKERVLMLGRARAYFQRRLGTSLVLGHRVKLIEDRADHVLVDGQRYDFLVDATWGHLTRPLMSVFYEPTMLLYYETDKPFPAVTMVDGPLCSIYPTDDPKVYTLSSVIHTPLGHFDDPAAARAARNRVDTAMIADKAHKMEAQIGHYVPNFKDHFRLLGPQLSIKTKPVASHDDRSCYVSRTGNIFTVMSGKIDTVFFAVERILALLELSYDSGMTSVVSSLKEDIANRQGVILDTQREELAEWTPSQP